LFRCECPGGDSVVPLAVCEERDSKGLYKKACSGELKGFTGSDAPNHRRIPKSSCTRISSPRRESVGQTLDELLPRLRLK